MPSAQIPFVGETSESKSPFIDYQKTVNLYLEFSTQGRSKAALYPTPGYSPFTTFGLGVIRGGIVFGDKLYIVSGDTLYEVTTTGGFSSIGILGTGSGQVSFAHNGTQIILVDGEKGYLYVPSTTTYTPDINAVDADFPNGATHVEFFDGYFIVNDPSAAGRVMFSASYNGLDWPAANFFTAERSPDPLQAVAVNGRELWLIGLETAEPWYNAGSPVVPFEPIQSGFSEWGCIAPSSVATNNGNIFWLTNNQQGQGQVIMAAGMQPKIISTNAIADTISSFGTISDAFGWTYDYQRHSFYVLTFPTANRTFVYDVATDQWHEWSSGGVNKRHISNFHIMFDGNHIIGSYEEGKLFTLDWDIYTENGNNIHRVRRSPYIFTGDDSYIFHHKVKVDFETGVGDFSTPNPQAMLRWTNNGKNFSNEIWRDMGSQGEYYITVEWRKLGRSKYRAYEIKITDPVKVVIANAFVEVSTSSRGD